MTHPRSAGSFPRRLVLAALVAAHAALPGCDRENNRPGVLQGTVEVVGQAPQAGAALLFLGGRGIGEITGVGGTLVFTHTPPGEEGGIRVLLVHPGDDAPLRFTVAVDRVGVREIQGTVLDVAGRDNARITDLTGYRVRLDR